MNRYPIGTYTLPQIAAMSQPRTKEGRWTKIRRKVHALKIAKQRTNLSLFPLFLAFGVIASAIIATSVSAVAIAHLINVEAKVETIEKNLRQEYQTGILQAEIRDKQELLPLWKQIDSLNEQQVEILTIGHNSLTQQSDLIEHVFPYLSR